MRKHRPVWSESGFLAVLAATLVLGLLFLARDAASAPPTPRAQGLSAFGTIAKVVTNPRCLNCHQAERPLQGDDRHAHIPRVERGPDNLGAVGMRCTACHSLHANNDTSDVPGAPNWSLAPLSMLWQGLTPGALCQALKDPARNGKRDGAALIKHMGQDKLVGWGWNPGTGRTPVDVPRAELVKAMKTWVGAGMPCPDEVVMNSTEPALKGMPW
jgi:hypothetical protein